MRHTLTAEEMATVFDQPTAPDTLVTLWRLLEPRWDEFTKASSLNPTKYAIPSGQWKIICKRLTRQGEDEGGFEGGFQAGMLMVSVGPSSW